MTLSSASPLCGIVRSVPFKECQWMTDYEDVRGCGCGEKERILHFLITSPCLQTQRFTTMQQIYGICFCFFVIVFLILGQLSLISDIFRRWLYTNFSTGDSQSNCSTDFWCVVPRNLGSFYLNHYTRESFLCWTHRKVSAFDSFNYYLGNFLSKIYEIVRFRVF